MPRIRRLLTVGWLAPALFVTALPAGVVAATSAQASTTPVYLDPSYTPQERAADLVSRMTLAEKVTQMNASEAPAITRLGVAAYGWWNEAAHGVACQQTSNNANCTGTYNTTSYPVALAAASTWDQALVYKEGTAVSDEAREVEPNNIQNMEFYAPTVNLSRDPRWGRNDETWGEDPYLTTEMAGQYIDGMQGQTESGSLLPSADGYLKTGTTVKHYAANNSESNRLTGNAVMDDRTLREYYTKQFRGLIETAHPTSIMSSYNEVNGVPSPANTYLNTILARETFGFQGYFTSDCDAIYEMQSGHNWKPPGSTVAVNATTRQAWALVAGGEDLDCNQGYNDGQSYATQLATGVAQAVKTSAGTLTENDIDVSLVRLFTIRMQLGEFDAETAVPWVAQARARLAADGVSGSWSNTPTNGAPTETADRLALARAVGDESIVLLKNQGSLLPLKVPSTGAYKVAVVGPFANPAPGQMYLGDYSSSQAGQGALNEVNAFQGLQSAITAKDPQAVVTYLPGEENGQVDPALAQEVAPYDAVVVVAGMDASTSTEALDRTNLTLPSNQEQMIEAAASGNPNTITYMETAGTVDVSNFQGQVPALLWSSSNGQRQGEALADVLLGAVNPNGHLPFTWYRHVTDLPPTTDYTLRADNGDHGRTYMYYAGADAPSFPFGYGLSYTTFHVGNVAVSDATPSANSTVTVTGDVTNTGTTAGADVVQLYAATPDEPASLERPAKRLLGFQRVMLNPGQTKTVSIPLKVSDLAFFDQAAKKWTVDNTRYTLQLGQNADDSTPGTTADATVSDTWQPALSTVTVRPVAGGDKAQGITERVQFPVGSTVTPNLTLGLADDELFGYVTEGQSTPLPAGATVSYSSDHPDVVSVDPSGTITAVNNGVATITATVSYGGSVVSGSQPVTVGTPVSANLPESPLASLLPLASLAGLAVFVVVRRRRSARVSP